MKKLTTEEFVQKAQKLHGSVYNYSQVKYTTAKEKVCIICPEHGKFLQEPNHHLSNHGCPKCGHANNTDTVRFSLKDFLKLAKAAHGTKYSYSKVNYVHIHAPVCIVCRKHGEFHQSPNNHFKGHGCPRCSHSVSLLETRVANWIKSLGVPVKTQQKLGRQSIDIFLPKFNLGIEINGLHWHSEKFKNSAYHEDKSVLAEKAGIRLIHFWEHQINNKAAIVKSMLRIKLGLAKLRIFARDCSVCKLCNSQAKEFLEKNHLQGAASAIVAYGLFLDEKLVSVMTLGKPRFNKEYQWEIIRLATLKNTVVVGGASKLFAAFVQMESPESVISYADLDYADGGVYKNLGFSLDGFSNPSYFWVKGKTVLPRYKTQKHKLLALLGEEFDANLSERENMQNAGYYRIFNSGNAVFVFKP